MLSKGFTKLEKIEDQEQRKAVIDFHKERALQALKLKGPQISSSTIAAAANEEENKGESEATVKELKNECFEALITLHIRAV